MTTSTSKRPRDTREVTDRREQIQKSAVEVFERKGFGQSSLKDIADDLGITREAIYYYFENKKDILLSMILEPSRLMLERAEEILGSTEPAPKKIEMALRSHLEHFSPSYIEVSIALRERSLLDDADFAELRMQWKQYEKVWAAIIAEGQKSGSFRADVNPKIMSYAVLGMCNWLSRWYRADGEIGIEELSINFYKLCTGGLLNTEGAVALP